MCVCVCVWIYQYVGLCIRSRVSLSESVFLCVYFNSCVHACSCAWLCAAADVYVGVCAWACACVNAYVYMRVCVFARARVCAVLSRSVLCTCSCMSVWVYARLRLVTSTYVYHSNHRWFLISSCASACVCLHNTCSPEHACVFKQSRASSKAKVVFGTRVCAHMHASFIIKVCACACAIHVSVMHSNQEQKQPSAQNTRDTIPKISSHPQSDAENIPSSSARTNTYARTYTYTPTCTHTHTFKP